MTDLPATEPQLELDSELDAFIAAEAGGPYDLNPMLEQAATEFLLAEIPDYHSQS